MRETELPLGFGMALAQNKAAMHAFETMTPEQKQAVIQKAHTVMSKAEMRHLVDSLTQGAQESK